MKNSRFKFRAWLHDDKNISDGCMFYNVYPMLNNEFYFDGDVADIDESVKLMQYAGFEDKSGEDVYGGDLLDDGGFGLLQVEFKNGCFEVFHISPNGHMSGDCAASYCANRQVIGNIYENPELLK